MRKFFIALTLASALAAPASAERVVIKGRASQALHCSAMLFMVSHELYKGGFISRRARDGAQRASIVMLDQVPVDPKLRHEAMKSRFRSIMKSRSPRDLLKEYKDTSKWCRREFLR